VEGSDDKSPADRDDRLIRRIAVASAIVTGALAALSGGLYLRGTAGPEREGLGLVILGAAFACAFGVRRAVGPRNDRRPHRPWLGALLALGLLALKGASSSPLLKVGVAVSLATIAVGFVFETRSAARAARP
jgi:hypothetical protein